MGAGVMAGKWEDLTLGDLDGVITGQDTTDLRFEGTSVVRFHSVNPIRHGRKEDHQHRPHANLSLK